MKKINNLTVFLFVAVPILLIALLVTFGLGMFATFPAAFLAWAWIILVTAYLLLVQRHAEVPQAHLSRREPLLRGGESRLKLGGLGSPIADREGAPCEMRGGKSPPHSPKSKMR
eukprot:scaffold190564_cov19-Tisochrysis_lutea.AAC.1